MKTIALYESVTKFIGEINDTKLRLSEQMVFEMLRVHKIL
jgi:hypothetical protein